MVLSSLALVLAAAALIVALSRSGAGAGDAPSYTAAQKAEAKAQLCDRYRLAAHAMHIETGTPDNTALARIALSNGALILETASENPALDVRYRDAARALSATYQYTAAIGTSGLSTVEEYDESIDDMNEKTVVLRELCGD